ncbi:MAG: hypothetical protein ACRC1Y_01155, partial [Paraclostridium sp.]
MIDKKWSKRIKLVVATGVIATSITPLSSLALQSGEFNEINMEKIMSDIALLAANDNARVAGFEGEHDAAN